MHLSKTQSPFTLVFEDGANRTLRAVFEFIDEGPKEETTCIVVKNWWGEDLLFYNITNNSPFVLMSDRDYYLLDEEVSEAKCYCYEECGFREYQWTIRME